MQSLNESVRVAALDMCLQAGVGRPVVIADPECLVRTVRLGYRCEHLPEVKVLDAEFGVLDLDLAIRSRNFVRTKLLDGRIRQLHRVSETSCSRLNTNVLHCYGDLCRCGSGLRTDFW